MAKLTLEQVRETFTQAGYELLETSFVSTKLKLRYRCPKHPDKEMSMLYSNLRRGQKCPYCSNLARLTKEDIILTLQALNFEIVTDDLPNYTSRTQISYKCLSHPTTVQQARVNGIRRGLKCPICCLDAKRIPWEDVFKMFSERGYTLLETSYTNTKTRMRFLCPNHPNKETFITVGSLQRGQGCRYCGKDNAARKMSGGNSHFWKGGLNKLNSHMRRKLSEWKLQSLELHDYRCALTGENHKDIQIHHVTPFNVLRDEVLAELNFNLKSLVRDYSDSEIEAISERMDEYHREAKGVPLRRWIHELFHSLYGYKGTLEDFEQFQRRFKSGEFAEHRKEA